MAYQLAAGLAAGVAGAAVSVLLVDDSVAALAAGAALSPVAGAVAGAEVDPEEPLKSVTYQPEPLSWKPAAVTCFWKLGFPQEGHSVSTGSEIFCSTSLANPQDSHL
jgi:hypothetical protein